MLWAISIKIHTYNINHDRIDMKYENCNFTTWCTVQYITVQYLSWYIVSYSRISGTGATDIAVLYISGYRNKAFKLIEPPAHTSHQYHYWYIVQHIILATFTPHHTCRIITILTSTPTPHCYFWGVQIRSGFEYFLHCLWLISSS